MKRWSVTLIKWLTPQRWFWLLLACLVPIHLAIPDSRKEKAQRCTC